MKKIQFEKNGKSITDKEFQKFENYIHNKMPQDFKEFYLCSNGGVPVQYIYWKDDNIYTINHFLPISHGLYDDFTIEIVYMELIDDGIMPSNYLPFILEESGGYFLLSLDSATPGHIFFWNHEYDDDNFEDNIHFIDNSLTEFLNNLTENHPD